MPTRLKRPPFWRPLGLTAALLAFQGYLGFSAIGGQFGIESRAQILADIDVLKNTSSALQAEIDAYKHRATLMDTRRLDPDLVTERARAMLNMANEADIIVMVDPRTGKPLSGSFDEITADRLNGILNAETTL
ncbi:MULTISPECIES: septum formation initiator family protein [unclassified Devosia]|uniref:FtsB family cell division protein n=1 Tax=unclassified Devosia TaxID=196773 RepID=UPI001556FA92|nr:MULTISPECIES: septum formation initiator family protein [unclassified Devosia]